MARFHKKFEHLSEKDRALVEQFGEALANKILHGPMTQLRHVGAGERGIALAGALRYLFRLDEATDEEKSAPPRNRT